MRGHLPILRRVGWVLVVVGLLDIGVMIYCIANQLDYSSSLNVFAVIAGVLLLRGHLGAVRVVTWFSAFMLSGLLLSSLAVFPWMRPADYWLITLRTHPVASLTYVALALALLWMLFWVYRQLRLPAVVDARVAAGHNRGAPRSAFVAGVALATFLAVVLQLTMNGETAGTAKRLAAEKHGQEFKYFVTGISWNDGHVSAQLTAYREDEAKEVTVEWQQ